MPELLDGESVEVKGSAAKPYVLKNTGGLYSCTCPAWRNQSVGIERRTCKHLRKLRGDGAEQQRIGAALPVRPEPTSVDGEPVQPAGPGLLLAQTWTNDVDLSGWWMSEKLDGVRAYWDGRQFNSRQGNRFYAPDWFVEQLPQTPLDGELWLARKSFQRTVSIVRRQDKSELWRELVFVVFDAPAVDDVFERRLEFLRDSLAAKPAQFARLLEHETCRNLDHLRIELDRIEALGGEGLMLRQPGSRYEAGRSSTLLKIKRFHDAEARVIGYLPGAGRHKGRLGALAVELPDGTRFSVGTGFSDAQREQPPAVGSQITFRYQELSDRGVPRFPSFVRVRRDMNQAGGGISQESEKPEAGNARSTKPVATSAMPSSEPAERSEQIASTQRYELVEGNSAKFWEVSVDGASVTVRFGCIGTQGQTQTKSLADAAAAVRHRAKLIAEKTAKGYKPASEES